MEKLPFDLDNLSEVLRLVKGRDASAIQRPEGKEILRHTNALLKGGLLTNLLTTLKDDVNDFCKPDAGTVAVANGQSANQLQIMRLKADIVFFTAYQTQFEEAEAAALLATTKFLSDLLLSAGSQNRDDGADWCPPIYSLLVVLQLAHVAALQQTTSLLSRHVDYAQPMYQQCRAIEDVIEVGNNLPQSPGSRCGMEYAGKGGSNDWLCDGAKGFACLAFAILRQPEVDVDHAPASDVEWFLHEACRLRAYSYIRLCVLPVLQAAYLQDRDTTLFYVAVLCELMENLAKIFCMTHYKQVHAHNENDFPYIFFPPTGEFYADNMAFYANRVGTTSGQKLAPAPAVDSLEDVVSVYTALLELRPEFAHTFWPSTQSHDIEVQQRQHQQQQQQLGGMQQTSEHHDIVDHYYHPFVMKAVDASFHHPGLMITAIRFVAALSNSPLGRTAYAGYLFVLDSSHHRFSWSHFFDSMDTIALQLGASLSAAASTGAGGFGAAGYTGGMPAFGQPAQQQLVQHNFNLTEKDAEGLVAIMKLIAAVAVHPAVAALLHESFRPVPRLFALLSCALPITLKGAILKTLSVFARGSAAVSEEIWVLVEAHRLLPITTAQFGSAAGAQGVAGQGQLFGAKRAAAQGRGLRTELEEAESRAGRYPVTEGFLQLLDALLSHGTPDNTLGQGYRRPGLMVYLDYVVEDVLLKCQDRSYQPADWPSARAQRWRVTAHCLTVLCTLLRNYHINAVPADTVQAAEEWMQRSEGSPVATLLRDAVADFRDQSAEYTLEGSAAPQRCSRPKSAAFMVMSLLLGRARLFDYLGYVLLECSPENLERSFNEHCVSEVGAAVDLLQKQYELAHPSVAAKVESTFDFSFPMAGVSAASTRGAAQAPPEEIEPLDLTSLGRESHLCDLVFWQERSVAGAVGLVYECALREEKFMSLFRSAPGKLTVTRVSEQGRVAVLPVIAHDLSELLCADRDNEMLSLIAQVVPAHVRSCPCLPSVNVLGVRILEHVALHLPAARLIAALVPVSQSQQSGYMTADRNAGPSWYLMQGCAAALKTEAAGAGEDGETLHYDVICMGGDAYPQFFSLSAAYSRNVAPPNLYLTMINADSAEEAAQVDAEVIRALRLGGTIREAVLSLLLRTLTPGSVCLSHQLLGLIPASGSSNTASKFLPEGCLDAVLYLLSPASTPLGSTFLQQSPEQAADCFELVYRLSASPVTSAAVLRRLGDRQVDFFRVQLTLVAYLMHLSDEELLEGADQDSVARTASNGSGGVNPSFASLQAIKTALGACCAWLLKTCTLYLRFAELHRTATTTAYSQSLLELLFSGCDSLPFEDGRGGRMSVLEKLLGCATSFPSHPNQASRLSPAVLKALEACSVSQRLTKAGAGWGDNNPFLRQDAAHAAALSYQVVDLRALGAQMKRSVAAENAPELPEALNAAVLVNIHNKAAAVLAHLCMAWCQLVNMITAGGRTLQTLALVLGSGPGGQAQLPRITATDRYSRVEPRLPYMSADGAAASRLLEVVAEQLFRPTAAVLAAGLPGSSEHYRPLPEHFARCLLSQVKVLTAPLETGDSVFEGEAAFMLAPEQHTQLLETVVALLLQRPRDLSQDAASAARRSGAGDVATSTAYRGLLAAALVRVLQAPSKFAGSCPESQDVLDAGWSQENKSQQDSAGMIDATALIVSECEAVNKVVLAQRAGELADALGRDCAQRGGGMWQLSSIGALTTVMAALQVEGSARSRAGDREGQVFGSHAFLQVLHVLVQRGHLQSLLASALEAPGNAATSDDREALLMSALGLCKHVASCVEGAEALVACGTVQKLVALDYFLNPPPFPDEIAYFGADVLQSREAAVEQLQSRYVAVISLLRCLFAAAPHSQPVAQGVGRFLTKNQVLVTQLLRMRYLTLGGLTMTEATVAVIAMLAAVPGAPLRQPLEGGDVLASALGTTADSFQADICTLLGVVGRSPIPASLTDTTGNSKGEGWWDHIQPAGGADSESYEAEWARTQCSGPAAEGMPADWSVFDDRKLQLSLQVLTRCCTFLRLSSSPQRAAAVPTGSRATQAVVAMEAFCRCAALSQELLTAATAEAPSNSILATAASLIDARSWLQSPLAAQTSRAADGSGAQWEEGTGRRVVADALLLAAENLICAVHNCALTSADGGAASSALPSQQTQRVLEVAAAFPSHSFIRQVARWIKDLLLK